MRLKGAKPELLANSDDTLGDHLRRARRKQGLLQCEAAALMGVCHTSVLDWEAGKQPYDRMYPVIIAFLGYEPWPDPQTLADTLRHERRRRRFSAKATAQLIGIDEATYARWERNGEPSRPEHRAKVTKFLGRTSR